MSTKKIFVCDGCGEEDKETQIEFYNKGFGVIHNISSFTTIGKFDLCPNCHRIIVNLGMVKFLEIR